MEDYTRDDVLDQLNALDKKSRKRNLVDQRSYLIGVLAHRFDLSEHVIAKLTGMKRGTVNYNKRLPILFKDDPLYQKNIYVYAQLFPHDFSKTYSISSNRNYTVILTIEKSMNKKLIRMKDLLDHDDIRITIKHLLNKSIKLWEE